jgi:YD repeat-containing protein
VVRGIARDERTTVASFRRDGMGRVVASTAADGGRTITYDDTASRVVELTAAGLSVTREYDGCGRLVRVDQMGEASGATPGVVTTRSTRYVYNHADQLRMLEDAQDGRRFRFYDAAGRLEFSVDATGAVTRSDHAATGQVVRQTRYQNLVDPSGWFDEGTRTVTKLSLTGATPGMMSTPTPQ